MEREINSTFYDKHHNVTLLVVETGVDSCMGCFYNASSRSFDCKDKHNLAGKCGSRIDGKNVIFKKEQ